MTGYYSGAGHYMDETRDISSLSNSSSGSHKHGGENVEPERGKIIVYFRRIRLG